MDSKEFKALFADIAKLNDFQKAFGGWYKESSECIVVIDLQKSNFGDYYEMNIKIYIQGMFGQNYSISKDLVKKDIGDVFRRQPQEYNSVFDFDKPIDDRMRHDNLKRLFSEFIVPFTNKALSMSGIKELATKEEIFLLPVVKEKLG